MRGGRGEVVSSFGTVQGPRWTGKGQTSVRVEMLGGGDNSLISSYKYMFQRLRDVRDGESMFSLLPSARDGMITGFMINQCKCPHG